MNRRFGGFVVVGMILVMVLALWGIDQIGDITFATAVGMIRTSGTLSVLEQPEEDASSLKFDGSSVALDDDTKVSVLGKSDRWYKIRFRYQGQKLEGYVPEQYLDVMNGDADSSIDGVVSNEAVIVRSAPVQSGSVLKFNDTAVRLNVDKKICIEAEVVMYGFKYYKISFLYGGQTLIGFVPAKSITADYTTALYGVIHTSGQAVLRQEAGKTTPVTIGGSHVVLDDGAQVVMTGEELVDGVKYIMVEITIDGSTYQGYVAANLLRFRQVEVEAEVTAEPTPAPTFDDTPRPLITPTLSPKPYTRRKAVGSGNNATMKVSDKQFKKQLVAEGFPSSYISLLMTLHQQYPNWEFKAYTTGLDWSSVVAAECEVGLNLLSNSKSDAWKSREEGAYNAQKNKYIVFDGTSWVTASEEAVKYYLDPRNFMDGESIFQFESLEYQQGVQTQAGVENVLKYTPMYQCKYKYISDEGKLESTTYSKTFMIAAASSGVSPYHLASRVKQEVVVSPTSMSSSVSGHVSGYEGIYNYYNIGANNSTKSGGAVANGLAWASQGDDYLRPWNTVYKSIVGGAQYLGSNYINVGQNTLYLQKFNVTANNTYKHQYMSNIEAPYSEAVKTSQAYGADKANMKLVFNIPVYVGMPSKACQAPAGN